MKYQIIHRSACKEFDNSTLIFKAIIVVVIHPVSTPFPVAWIDPIKSLSVQKEVHVDFGIPRNKDP